MSLCSVRTGGPYLSGQHGQEEETLIHLHFVSTFECDSKVEQHIYIDMTWYLCNAVQKRKIKHRFVQIFTVTLMQFSYFVYLYVKKSTT